MRIASLNVENLFSRARAMNQEDWAEGKPILTEFSKLNAILGNDNYTSADKTAILASLDTLGLSASDENKFVILRQNWGQLVNDCPPSLMVQQLTPRPIAWPSWSDSSVN